ncbi:MULTISPECIES: DUF1269 domain-containing protein [Haloferax]|uniref:DUF1269 domain-containing protein n=2 Tax=Haloferax TaxID=2251 RepID=A0A6G1Z718_9EURY|nr:MULTISPECIES: DUF1269 domain-containing protein [Haloferax]KAB1185168.1 DUF1269 domain-containing protein [Haloferax sp. CBA1149]MRW82346.1 DUF1269 domain-containing protein [Haloferax marinisediminis]
MSSSLIVLAFDTLEGAKEARDELYDLQKQELIQLDDAAVVVRKENGKVKVDQAVSLVGTGALGGAFWGMLIGLLFLAPWLGLAVGAVTGALSGKFADYGIDDDFIKEVGDTIEPGHSALFLLVRSAQGERVVPELESLAPKVLRTNLSPEQEDQLREAFGQEPTAA